MAELLADGCISTNQLSIVIGVRDETLVSYITGIEPMPLNYQARLAIHVIATFPAFIRQGNRLRSQVAAAIEYETGQTQTHMQPLDRHIKNVKQSYARA